MSNHAVKWARKVRVGEGTTKCVLIALATYADASTDQAWPMQETLAWELELTDRTIRKALKKLEDMGIVTRKKRFRRDGKPTSDLITINLHHRNDVPAVPPEQCAGGEPSTTGILDPHHRNITPSPPEPRSAKYPSESSNEPPPKRASTREEKVFIHEFQFGDAEYDAAWALGLSEDQADRRRTSWLATNANERPDTPTNWRKRWIGWCERYAADNGLTPKTAASTEVIRQGVMIDQTDADYELWEIHHGRKLPAGKSGKRWFPSRKPPAGTVGRARLCEETTSEGNRNGDRQHDLHSRKEEVPARRTA